MKYESPEAEEKESCLTFEQNLVRQQEIEAMKEVSSTSTSSSSSSSSSSSRRKPPHPFSMTDEFFSSQRKTREDDLRKKEEAQSIRTQRHSLTSLDMIFQEQKFLEDSYRRDVMETKQAMANSLQYSFTEHDAHYQQTQKVSSSLRQAEAEAKALASSSSSSLSATETFYLQREQHRTLDRFAAQEASIGNQNHSSVVSIQDVSLLRGREIRAQNALALDLAKKEMQKNSGMISFADAFYSTQRQEQQRQERERQREAREFLVQNSNRAISNDHFLSSTSSSTRAPAATVDNTQLSSSSPPSSDSTTFKQNLSKFSQLVSLSEAFYASLSQNERARERAAKLSVEDSLQRFKSSGSKHEDFHSKQARLRIEERRAGKSSI